MTFLGVADVQNCSFCRQIISEARPGGNRLGRPPVALSFGQTSGGGRKIGGRTPIKKLRNFSVQIRGLVDR
jgi:hypothetical protein